MLDPAAYTAAPPVAPNPDAITAALVGAFTDALSLAPGELSGDDPLDGLAADSLVMLRVLEEVGERLGVTLDVALLFDHETLADVGAIVAALARQRCAEPVPGLMDVVIASSFPAEPLAESLEIVLAEAGFPARTVFEPYNQILQSLLDAGSSVRSAGRSGGFGVLLWRLGDWFRYGAPPEAAVITSVLASFESALAHASRPGLVVVCPESTPDPARDAAVSAWLGRWPVEPAGLGLLDLRGGLGTDAFDPVRDAVGHIPYTPTGFAALALAVARAIHARLAPPVKVIALDADNTLWDGVVGEDGAAGVRVSSHHRALHTFMREQRDAGRLLALASKNREADVHEVFTTRRDLGLRWEDFAARSIDWAPKSAGLRAIAAELGLGLDSFVFVDDNPLEVAEVRAGAPEVLAVTLPDDPQATPSYLHAHWAFDRMGAVTAEDRRRAEMVDENRARAALETDSGEIESFLAALELQIDIDPVGSAELARAAQLTHRTNQFNATTVRRDEAALDAWLTAEDHMGLAIRVRDRFGDYGFVGLVLLERRDRVLVVDSFMLSCRALGRRVEHRMLGAVVKRARALGAPEVTLKYEPTPRNEPLAAFFATLGFPEDHDEATWPVEQLEAALDRAAEGGGTAPAPDAITRADREPARTAGGDPARTGSRAPSASAAAGAAPGPATGAKRSAGLDRLAERDRDPAGAAAALVRELASRVTPRPAAAGPYVAPRTPLEHRIAGLWSEVLRIDRVGRHDDFHALGGDSLDLAELTVRLSEVGAPEDLALGALVKPTVAALAEAIEDGHGVSPRPAVPVAPLAAEAKLPGELVFVPAPAHVPRRIFLTGATGYVGAYLLAELLAGDKMTIDCHVRATGREQAFERVRANLARYGLWDTAYASRVIVRTGDLAAPRLGLSAPDWAEVALNCDAIVHNGAWVNFLYPYERLRPANVGGTIETLQLAAEGRPKTFHFVSTLGVLMSGGYGPDRVFAEDDELDHSDGLPSGYEQSKWVADRLVTAAMARGLTGSVYRLGMLAGLMDTGTYHKVNEFLPSFLKGCVQLGAFPDLDTKVEMVPVDFVCRVLAEVIGDPAGLGRVYQMNHPAALPARAIVETIRQYGYPLRLLPWELWKRELLELGRALRGNALYPFLDFIRPLRENQTFMPEMRMTNFLAAVERQGLTYAPQDVLMRRYLDHFVTVGFLAPPT